MDYKSIDNFTLDTKIVLGNVSNLNNLINPLINKMGLFGLEGTIIKNPRNDLL